MDGLALLREAADAGLSVSLEGERLVVRGPRRAEGIAQRLLACKAEVVNAITGRQHHELPPGGGSSETAILTGITPEDLPWDWRIEWLERAAIREVDGGQAREHAEAEALRDVVRRMRRSNGQSAAGAHNPSKTEATSSDVEAMADQAEREP